MSSIISKADFFNRAMAELEQYPALAARLKAGDVTITQQFGAMASMMAMLSYQVGLAETEVWEKTRDSMVLADAAIKGILPMAVAASYYVVFDNPTDADILVSSGRRLLDNQGRIWRVVDGGSVAAQSQATFKVQQIDLQQFTHTVAEKKNLYRFKVPTPDSEQFLCSIALHDSNSFTAFKAVHEFTNISENEQVYQVVVDEMMDMFVQFGIDGIAGYIPEIEDNFTITVGYTSGDAVLTENSPLSFEYLQKGEELVTIHSGELVNRGATPRSLDELRELAKYPFIYDTNAVFLGEFEFLIARHLRGFKFLSVWNEQREEKARGASIDNINVLNVAFINTMYRDSELKKLIKEVIARADDSYKVRFFNVVEQPINLTVKLRLANIYDEADIMAKVVSWLTTKYGYGSEFSKLGNRRINWQQSIRGIRESIPELNDGVSDISIFADEVGVVNPEVYRFVDESSISISNVPLDSYHSYG